MGITINDETLADKWEAVAPYGFTADGEIAPGDALDKFSNPIDSHAWNLEDFYNGSNFQGSRNPGMDIEK